MQGSAKPKDDAGVSGNDGAVTADSGTTDPCARFAVKVERLSTCDACAYPANCECVLGGFATCSFGRCATGMNCEVCKTPPNSMETLAEHMALLECVNRVATPLCTRDDECAGGKCVNQGIGVCQTGGSGSPCTNESDCFVNGCVTHDTGGQACAYRAPGEACNTDAHCGFSGRCLVRKTVGGVNFGLCSNGGVSSPCFTSADCLTFTCVLGTDDFGWCSTGELDSQCNTPADCLTNFCVAKYCTTGPGPCVSSSDCTSGVCQRRASTATGGCVSGDLGTLCVNDSGCRDGNCAFCPGGNCALGTGQGWCTLGTVGDPCVENGDCLSENCVSTRAPEPRVCAASTVLTKCGDEGICAPRDGTCYFGRCGP